MNRELLTKEQYLIRLKRRSFNTERGHKNTIARFEGFMKSCKLDIQKEPYCLFCGYKSKNHKESGKHDREHLKNVEKDTIEAFKNFKGVYCTTCGKLVGTIKQMEKHRCRIKKTK